MQYKEEKEEEEEVFYAKVIVNFMTKLSNHDNEESKQLSM